ncbi:aminoacyl-histidine dipeptidase PepD [Peptoclostridium acidaminophilum DSM 3953]|uniref:Cytosol non-specific dipeptidase n=1 Tax=Peptoclostridium acidaminophilum DSM 3953 TaxID=1286171 RepID=W8THR9_PEPAC|nr:aminoacyl-histidine dipeptidase [Peptoclostridium acidaminophilum]AHM57388.1 aminoacyl-histidine dipeptidase PepD [Peptoclostridium acidaminophilum DSM 3953]
MSKILRGLEPASVFKYFAAISEIPRGSGDEERLSNYIKQFANELGLQVHQDQDFNLIIKKTASPGYENAPTVILQGHMDMVCEKREDVEHDFTKDPIKLIVDGDFIKADGTTLGADNGIAVAYIMAVLADKELKHPPIEGLITTGEEVGMCGAAKLDGSLLSGKILINMDVENEGEIFTSCAGGVRARIMVDIKREKAMEGMVACEIKLSGLKGGHSGMEIDKKRGNANKLLGRVLYDISKNAGAQLSSIDGGAKMNAIPRDARAIVLVEKSKLQELNSAINSWENVFQKELSAADPNVKLEMRKLEGEFDIISPRDAERVISMLVMIPNGIMTMSQEIEGLVESSSNIGIITTGENSVEFDSAVRSNIKSQKLSIVAQMECMCKALGARLELEADYPEWEYSKDSHIRDIFTSVYEKKYEKKPLITAVHCGLECGIFKEVIGDIDIVAFGPDVYDVHTPDEHMSISSIKRTWEYLLDVLESIK